MEYRFRTTSSNEAKLEADQEQIGTIWQGAYKWDILFRRTAYTLKLGRKGLHLSRAGRRLAYLRQTGYGKLKVTYRTKDDDLVPLLMFLCLHYNG